MKLSLYFIVLVSSLFYSVEASSTYKFTAKRVKSKHLHERQIPASASQNSINSMANLTSGDDLAYLAEITIAGVNYTVQLDTGSSDLWVKGSTHPIPNTNQTTLTQNLTYAIGYAAGNIAYAPVEFVGFEVPNQAFLDISAVDNQVVTVGSQGIAGLGFTSRSVLDDTINKTQQSTGRSLLYNIFELDPTEPNFIAFALQRTRENSDEAEGTFSIGEYDPRYASISGSQKIPTYPTHSPRRWTVLLDAVITSNGSNSTVHVPQSRLPNTPSNKAVALLDSGATYTFCSDDMADALYRDIPGATFNSQYNYWQVPCNIEIDMALQIGGEVYPIHPLDAVASALYDPTTCLGSFIPRPAGSEYDWLVGDNFLRSVYSLYDFGDFDSNGQMGDPYVKLLSIIDPNNASVSFAKARGGTPRTNITYTGLDGAAIAPVFSISNDISQSLELIGKFVPYMLGIVALNALVLIICCIVWLVSFCRKRRSRSQLRDVRGRTTPQAMALTPRHSYIPGTPPPVPHVYEPVSMAMTEDTFVPPSPAFHKMDGSRLREQGDFDKERPKSVA